VATVGCWVARTPGVSTSSTQVTKDGLSVSKRKNRPGSDWLMASCGTGVQAKVYVAQAAEITSTTAQWDVVLTELEMGPQDFDFVGYFSFLEKRGYVEFLRGNH
jgi:hypothetical protein